MILSEIVLCQKANAAFFCHGLTTIKSTFHIIRVTLAFSISHFKWFKCTTIWEVCIELFAFTYLYLEKGRLLHVCALLGILVHKYI